MWFLVPKDAPDDRLHLPVGKELIVGRADGHVVIDDKSVSRKQAIITVKSAKVNRQIEFVVKLRDTSRFGSYVNGDRLLQNERRLREGDGICFGIPTGIQFNLVRDPLVVCGSTIGSSVKSAILKTLQFLGGELVIEWSRQCTLLVISRVSITIKVIGALIQGSCIVTPEYLFHLGDFHSGKRSSPPQASEYQPVVTQESQHLENADVDLLPRPERKELFKGDTFIFMTKKRFDRLATALELGGARCLLWETDEQFEDDGGEATVSKAIVFYEESATAWHRRIYDVLKKYRRRPIVDAEIGYAVLACSKEDYCNVAKRCDLLSRHGIPSISFSQLPSVMSQSVCDTRPEFIDSAVKQKLAQRDNVVRSLKQILSCDLSPDGMTANTWLVCFIIDCFVPENKGDIINSLHMPIPPKSSPSHHVFDCKTNRSRTREMSFSMLDETPMTSETAGTSESTTEERSAVIKEEVFSELEMKPGVLVPQTPPNVDEAAPDVTNITTVGCSLEAKVEEPWSEDATLLPESEEEEEDPFDRLPARQKRRKVTESPSRRSRNQSPRNSRADIRGRRNETEYNESCGRRGEDVISKRQEEPANGKTQGQEAANSGKQGETTVNGGRHNEKDSMNCSQYDVEKVSPRKRKLEDSVAQSKKPKQEICEDENEDQIPRNCTQIKFVSLMRKQGSPPCPTSCDDGPNFKRFRKNALPLPGRNRKTPALVANSRAEVAAVEESEQAASQSERSNLDSQADRLFEEMRRVAPGRRR